MAKRKKIKTDKENTKYLSYIAWFLAVIALSLSALLSGYYLGYENAKSEFSKKRVHKEVTKLVLPKKVVIQQKTSVNKMLKEVLKKETKTYILASHEIDDDSLANVDNSIKRPIKKTVHKPQLAIIIDDVSTQSQVQSIKNLHLTLTMSFLPPSKYRPNTPKLAAKEKLYMVHLPMEAKNFTAEEPFTLRVNDSEELIGKRIREIKKLFPRVHYINNHTGSKFTSNEVAVNKLIYALRKNNINFIDSRTTADTKVQKVLKNFGSKYIARDVFLDHKMDKPYILNQIKKAIIVAKKHGTAIAIGHPHKNTLEALRESKALFKDVDLIYINQI